MAPTATGQRYLTPTWASPEQIRGARVTTASDIYQLGLLLYRLLTGCPPYRSGIADPEQLRRAICDESPTRPSVAVSRSTTVDGETTDPEQIGRERGTSPTALRSELEGDLDNIVLMALRKEPDRRYGSVIQLIDDLDRYRRNLPVMARAPSWSYRAQKFVRRNRLAIGAAAALVLLLMSSVVIVASQSRETARERDRAEEVVNLLVEMLQSNDPRVKPGGDAQTVGELLETSEAQIVKRLADQPAISVRMKHVLGKVHFARSHFDRARLLLNEALDQQRALVGNRNPLTAEILHDLAVTEFELRGSQAAPLLRESLEVQQRAHGDRHPRVAHALYELSRAVEEPEEKLKLMTRALEMRRELLPPLHRDIAASLNQFANYHLRRQEFDHAERFHIESLGILNQLLGEDHPEVLSVRGNLALTYLWLQQFDRSEEMLRKNIELQRAVLGNDSAQLADSINNLASLQASQRDWDGAIATLDDAVAVYRRIHGRHHSSIANAIRNQGMIEMFGGRYEAASRYMDEAVATQSGFDGVDSVTNCHLRAQRAEVWTNLGRVSEARQELTQVVDILNKATPDGSRPLADALVALGRATLAANRAQEAKSYYERAVEIRLASLGEAHPWTWEAKGGVGMALAALGRTAEAEPLLREGFENFSNFSYANPAVIKELEQAIARLPR